MSSIIDTTSSMNTTNTTNTFNTDLLIDLTDTIKTINDDLIPGVRAEVALVGARVLVKYQVRVMVKGKRKEFGPFYSKQAAVQAIWAAKSGQSELATQLGREAVAALASLSATASVAQSAVVRQAEQAKGMSMSMSMQELDDLLVETETPSYLFTGEDDVVIASPTSGEVWSISPAMQRSYNDWCLQASSQSTSLASPTEGSAT